jgi:hypothetical protein
VRLCEEIGLEKLGWPVVVDAQNVADYWLADPTRHESWEEGWIVGAAPPWTRSWIEWDWDGYAVAVQCEAELVEPQGGGEEQFILDLRFCSGELPVPETYGAVVVLSKEGEVVVGPGAAPLDWKTRKGTAAEGSAAIAADFGTEDDTANLNSAALLEVFFFTLMFANCRNVTIRDETPHLTRQQRRHGPPAITYKVLDIAPMTRVLRDEGGIERNGLKKALHICRGHFAHYGPDAKLFGKYEGTFWHPMHTRGSAEHGVVVKDYKVSPRAPR